MMKCKDKTLQGHSVARHLLTVLGQTVRKGLNKHVERFLWKYQA